MSDERIARALDLFERVLGLDPAARPGFLSRECADDPQLRRRVEAMLRADGRDHTLLDGAAVPLAPALAPSGSGWTGRRVGPFRLQRELGRGGMGVVYLAERDDVGMRVAVKLLAGHFVAPERVARFDYERRLLARLEHPNIARFLDAGVADDGTPWLAMEYVAGSPIDQHSDARCLMVSERLTLFAQACEAVAHAHRNLLVHRDLKPSNVLVSDAGVLKLVDFGIAKLLAPGPDEDGFGAPVTMEAGTGPMTPEYASPEQLRGEKLTTASDVYQLGIVLHELLTGRRPVTRSGHPIRPFDRTSGVEPTRPSEVVASDVRPEQIPTGPTTRTSADLSALRRASPRLLKRQLEGDLDAILQTALHPDLSRRYASAQSLVDDIRRFQRGEPVLARTPTRRYRLRKAVRRHKVAVGLAGALALLTFVSAVGLGVQAHKLSVERDRAEQVSLMLERLVRTADPTSGPDSAREFGALREVQRAALEGVAKEPDAWGRLLIVVGVTHRNAGRADSARAVFEAVVQALEGRVSDHDPVLLDAIGSLGTLLVAEGEVERAIPLLERVVKESRALPVERRAELANSVADLGYAEQVRGDDAGARRHYEESIALFATLPDSGGMDRVLVNLGYLADRQGQLDSAEMFFRRALAYRRARHGEAHTRTLSAMTALARTLVHRGVLDEAERLSGIVLAARQRALKGPHDLTSDALVLRAQVLIPLGRGGEAEALGRAALAMSRQLHGEVHLNIPFAKAAIADAVASQGRRAEALAIRRQVLADYRRAAGARHPATILAMIRLAEDEQAARRLAESEQLFREAMPALDSIWEGRPVLAPPLTSFGALLAATSRCAEAEPYLRRAAVLAATRWPRDDERVRRPRALLDECRRRPADDRAGPSGAARPDDR